MHLLKRNHDRNLSLHSFRKGQIPRYAILSHTWGLGEDDEVTYDDIVRKAGKSKPGYQKLRFCGDQAAHHSLEYFWVDTCCIDKSKQVDYAEAINSMFRWYQNAERCYVYLSDVSVWAQGGSAHVDWQSGFRNSRWFQRGWTLQELLAPAVVEFYSREGIMLGDKVSLLDTICTITGIDAGALSGWSLSCFSIEERLRWAEGRKTTVEEDEAHCLLGIFGVHLPLIPAEGRANAMARLLEEVHKRSQTRPSARNNKHWLIPRRSNPQFTGQEELRTRLKERLLPSTTHGHRQDEQRTFVLHGIGGAGKSEVCIKFAEEQRERYWGVFWVDATSMNSAERSFAQIADSCGLGKTDMHAARYWLANNEHDWLLIIDNADDPDFDYSCYIPTGTRGSIIFTTRSPDCACYGNAGSSEVMGLSSHDAVELLLASCGIAKETWPHNTVDGQAVVDLLGKHPLAVIQAGAFIKKRFCTLQEYPEKFYQRRRDLLEFYPRQAQSTYRNVYATFDVSAVFLERSGEARHARALQLLNLLGFMNLNGVSESIFTRAAEHMATVAAGDRDGEDLSQLYGWHMERVPRQIMPQITPSGIDTFTLRESRDVLASLSLVKISGEGFEISIHPLVHAWIKDRLQESLTRFTAEWETAAIVLALSTKESIPYQDYLPNLNVQIAACLGSFPTSTVAATAPLDKGYGHLFYRLGYSQVFDYVRSPCVTQVLSRYLGTHGLNARNRMRCHYILGVHLIEKNSIEAVALLEDVVRVESSTLAEHDLERLISQHDLAVALIEVGYNARAVGDNVRAMGDNARAVGLLEGVVRIRDSTLPETDRDRLNSQHVLACALINTGDNARAVELLVKVVRIQESTLPETDRSRLTSQHTLAYALMNMGDNARAVALLEEVVRIRQSTLPETDRQRLAAQYNLAQALMGMGMGMGDDARAVALLEEVVRIQQSTLPETDHDRLASQQLVAQALAEAREWHSRQGARRKTIGTNLSHPESQHHEHLRSSIRRSKRWLASAILHFRRGNG